MVYFYLLFIIFSFNPFIQTLSIMQTSPKQTLSILRYEHPKILKACLAVFQHYTSKDWYESFKEDMHTVHPVTHDHFCVHTISCLFTQFKSLMINFEPRIKRWNTLKWVYGSKVKKKSLLIFQQVNLQSSNQIEYFSHEIIVV